ncbi:hypothetical protein M8J76_001101 [Diaphorina citri]|nr:hypothetical protein M8J76_001101 [Diaphorina citri]
MVHVSSAYVNADRKYAEEVIYPAPGDPDKIIKMCQELAEKDLVKNASEILGTHVNMYTLTKALAEHEVAKAHKLHPTVIVRPSMIVGAWREPVPGWTISRNGPQGFFMGAANGVVRRLPVDKDLIYDYIPIDVVVNNILVAGWFVHAKRPASTPVYHATSSTCNPFRWRCLISKMFAVLHDYPSAKAVWYPTLKLLPSITLYKISLIRLHRTINKSLNLLEPFIFNEWKFDNTKGMALEKEIPAAERDTFYLNITNLDWEHFYMDLAKGVRRYLLNEDDSTVNAAKRKDRKLMYMNIIVQIGFFSLLLFAIQSLTSTAFFPALLLALPVFLIIMFFL